MDSRRRDRERERERDRDRDRDSRKSTTSSKSSRDYSRTKFDDHLDELSYDDYRHHRSRSRSRDRSSYHYKSSSNNVSGSGSKSGHKYASNCDVQKPEDNYEPKWSLGTPSTTIMMKSIPTYLGETEIKVELSQFGVVYKDFRLVKSRDTGTSRGFAFIEFNTLEEAQRWMDANAGSFYLDNSKVHLIYSQPKWDSNENRFREKKSENSQATDWDCNKCGVKNFKRREHCFKCHIPREESDKLKEGEGYEHVGVHQCNTLLVRGLDALTTEETIENTIKAISNITPKNTYIARDNLTNLSNGFGFIEFNSVSEATQVIETIALNSKFEIDNKCVQVDYSKNNFSMAITQVKSAASMTYPALTRGYEPYYARHYENANNSKVNQADAANSAAAVAQAAMKNIQKKIQVEVAYTTPDVSTYTFDEASGYYYDALTGFYYDSKTQYYYNPLTLKWMYWDANSMNYIPITDNQQQTSSSAETETRTVEPAPKKAKLNTATEIAKNMEKWAESQNKKKKLITTTTAAQSVTATPTVTTAQSVLSSVETPIVEVNKVLEASQPTYQLMNNDGSNSSNPLNVIETMKQEEQIDESKFIDTSKLACLLCKRKFDSSELLQKHCQMSQLHKKNLDQLKADNQQKQQKDNSKESEIEDSLQAALKYRDRAKERREKFGLSEPQTEARVRLPVIEEPIQEQIIVENNGTTFASKLMKKMGWNEGSGLGRNNQGISAPIEASVRQRGLGLGASGVQYDPNDTYKEAVRKSAMARFRQLN